MAGTDLLGNMPPHLAQFWYRFDCVELLDRLGPDVGATEIAEARLGQLRIIPNIGEQLLIGGERAFTANYIS